MPRTSSRSEGGHTRADGIDCVGDVPTDGERRLAGHRGAMTGPLEDLSRNQMNELIERAGGKSSSSVSKKTSLVVAGEGAGSKRAKAETLGIRLSAPGEFARLVADYLP
jgi:DNA ligase (NAD+)